MAKEICISTTPHETRLAILEDDQLAEIYYERENEYTLAGSIYKGRVTRVLPGMQSSFVDVGLERDAFLYVTDFLEEQEDSEEYSSESNGGRREARPRSGGGEEPQGRLAGSERNGSERNQDPSQDRSQERSGRRPASASAVDLPREAGREGGRAGRERAREQAVAPLREAVPAAQDLEEKGDGESPEGTRRWRGRRGRRRGVRGGLAQATPRPAATELVPEAVEHAEPTPELAAPAFHIPNDEPEAAQGPLLTVHASPEREDAQPGRRSEPGRDRGARRSREPYAEASTLDRPARSREIREQATPAVNGGGGLGGSIVLPGESLSKYGSAPADPTATAPATATVPKSIRAVNYVAPKPASLVELTGSWDGGAVLPGETLSRYREPAAAQASAATASPALVAHQDTREAEHASLHALTPVAEAPQTVDAPEETAHSTVGDAEMEQADKPVEPVHAPSLTSVNEPTPSSEPAIHAEHAQDFGHAEAEPTPGLAEPEMVTAAISPEAEAPAPHVAEPVHAHGLVDQAQNEQMDTVGEQHEVPDTGAAAEAAEYEPENASASYRVQPTAPSALRMAAPELEEAPSPETHSEALQELALYEEQPFAEPTGTFAEPTGTFADADQTYAPQDAYDAGDAVPASDGLSAEEPGKAAEQHAEPFGQAFAQSLPEQDSSPQTIELLHAHGSISHTESTEPEGSSQDDTQLEAGMGEPAGRLLEAGRPEANGREASSAESASPVVNAAGESEGRNDESQEAGLDHASTLEFSELVDRLQGFAPGNGLLEEETIDEDEYDFEPMHLHAQTEDGDQEDLEEETLDQSVEPSALGDAVRDLHLEHRVQAAPHVPEGVTAFETEEDDAAFGLEEVDEGEEESEAAEEGDEPAHSAQPGEPQRSRTDEGRGRGRGRSGGRNGGRRNGPGRGRSAQTQDLPIISDMLKQGQEILVQIAKEPIAKKGARITSHIALPGRFLVFMPTVHHVGVSRKIESDEERQRLKRILISEKGESSGGFIVRTAADGASEEDLRADLRFLISLWTEIKQRSDSAKAPALIYHDLNLIERILRDQVSSNFSTIWVDSEAEYERIIRFLNRFQPQLVRRVKLYTKETPLFEHFGIQEEISKALKSKVWLKSGGSIVINQTEALVAIDINTGKFVGKTSRLEDTIVKTNLDAIPEIVRQIRLRDLGGIIVIDFIDMDERKNRNRVLAALEEELKNDRAPSKVLQFNDFGLVAITRKRVKQSLERTLSVTCETCTGTGMVKSPVTVCNEIYTEMRKMLKHLDGKDVMLRVHPEVVKQLKAGNGKWINELEEMVTKTIIIKSDPALHPEQFDIH